MDIHVYSIHTLTYPHTHTYQFVGIYKLPLERLSPFMFPQTLAVKVFKGPLPCFPKLYFFPFKDENT